MSEFSFLNIEFLPVSLSHYQILTGFLKKYHQPLSGYTLATLTAWDSFYRYQWGFAEPETLLISYVPDVGTQRNLLQPVGPVSAELTRKIIEGASALPHPLMFVNVSNYFLKENPELVNACSVREDRSYSNYVYRTDALARLPGRKYAKKRNLLSQASDLYRWSCRELTAGLTNCCFEVLDLIDREEQPVIEGMLAREISALKFTLEHFEELELEGLLVFVDDAPVAFSIFEAINPKTVAIHFERALRRYKGLYQVINLETARIIALQGYQYINREEDLGDPGLRDAKKSYHPVRIIPSYELKFSLFRKVQTPDL